MLEKAPAEWLDDVAHARPFTLVERPGAADDDQASRASLVHRFDDAAGRIGAHRGRFPPVSGADGGDDGVAPGHRLDDRGWIHDIGDDHVEAGSVRDQPRGVSNDGAHVVAGGEALLDHLQARASCCSEHCQLHGCLLEDRAQRPGNDQRWP